MFHGLPRLFARSAAPASLRVGAALRPAAASATTPVLVAHRFFSSTAHQDSAVLAEVKGDILYITFNKPSTYNSMTKSMGVQFEQIVHDYASPATSGKPEVKAVVCTGAGKAFSSGGDLAFLLARTETPAEENRKEMLAFYEHFLSVRKLQVPVIAAINGPAVGAGACFSLACDMRLMADTATMGFTFVKLGLFPGMAATHNLPKLVGTETASRLLLGGEIVDAGTAKAMGLVHDVVPAAELMPTANKLAATLAANYSLASRRLVATLRKQREEGLRAALENEAARQAECYQDPHYRAQVLALINKSAGKDKGKDKGKDGKETPKAGAKL